MNIGTRSAIPGAGAMLEALRGLGYSTAAAIADIIDNSLSAGASEVHVDFSWRDRDSFVRVLDNGGGMDDQGLENAMRLGEKDPLAARAADDLGRFGMGLKTASLSQCRRLTVASRRAGSPVACLRWDLDALAACGKDAWLLFEGPTPGSEDLLQPLAAMKKGTLVLWEVMDRIVADGFTLDDFNDLIDSVERQLAMVFHRLLEGPAPAFRLLLTGRRVEPWDPFLSMHPFKAFQSDVNRITTSAGVVSLECHVLPHQDCLTDEELKFAAGPDGWHSQQGFYVYRNRRLLVAGGWLGLGQGRGWNREEAFRLARIRLDIPNTADHEWKIDIRKSVARPPASLRPWLTRFAEDARERARRVFAFRGQPVARDGSPISQAWVSIHARDGIRYRVDRKHPAVSAVMEQAGPLAPQLQVMLTVIEETVPVQRIWLDTAENRETPQTGFAGEPEQALLEVLQTVYLDMTARRGMNAAQARRALKVTEPFQNFPAQIDALPDSVSAYQAAGDQA